jgi:ketosteroid isomerase-like protein
MPGTQVRYCKCPGGAVGTRAGAGQRRFRCPDRRTRLLISAAAPQDETMTQNPNLAVQSRFVSAVFAGDRQTILDLAHEEFQLHEGSGMPFAGTFHGGEGFWEFLGIFNETFELEYLTPTETFQSADPDRIAFEFALRGKLRTTGELFDSTLIEVWEFCSGKVRRIKPHYFNSPLHARE